MFKFFLLNVKIYQGIFFVLGGGNHDTVHYTQFAGKTVIVFVRQLRRSIDTMTFSLNIKHADYKLNKTFGLVNWALISPIKFAVIKF